MATDLSGSNYSETDASNNNAAPNGMPEGMAPSGVNDAGRQLMGAVKRAYDRDHAGTWATVGGTANAITLAYTTGPTAYVQGEKFAFKATALNTGATTVNVSGLGVLSLFRSSGGVPVACVGGEIQVGQIVEIVHDGTQLQIVAPPTRIAQIVKTETGAVNSGTTIIPLDDTIPQITEGDEYMTLAITPKNTASMLMIDISANVAHGASSTFMAGALFQDATANALAVTSVFQSLGTGPVTLTFRHMMTAGTTSATTFRFRAGGHQAGTTTFNGQSGVRFFGGVLASSMTITEVLP